MVERLRRFWYSRRPVRLLGIASALVLFFSSSGLPSAQAQDARAEARVHFERGLELYDEGHSVEALSEFEEAYRLAPNPRLLFNMGLVYAELGRSVEAADALARFLDEVTDVDAATREEARAALRTQRARIGHLALTLDAPGARVFVDDVERGTAPLDPIDVSAGEHVIAVQAPGYESLRHRFRVAGGATYTVSLSLVPSGSRGATLRVECRVPGVDVRVDGVSLGLTPLEATVPIAAGSHRVEGVRDGYTPYANVVEVADGTETRVVIATQPDESAPASSLGALRLRVPSTSTTLRVDGEIVPVATELSLPLGLHDVEISAAEREPVAVRVDVPPDGFALTPDYRWLPDARQDRVDAANDQRGIGLGLAVSGGILLAAGAALLIGDLVWYYGSVEPRSAVGASCLAGVPSRYMDSPECREQLQRFDHPGLPPIIEVGSVPGQSRFIALVAEFNRDLELHYALLSTAVSAAGLGALGLIVGLVLHEGAPSGDDIDREASAGLHLELDLGPGHLGLRGSF